jgi:hypothetical protein
MPWQLVFRNLDDLDDQVRSDDELRRALEKGSIDQAGGLLNRRAGPHVRGVTQPGVWNWLKEEIFELVCERGVKYAHLRSLVSDAKHATATWFIPAIAAALGAQINMEGAVLAPFVALALLGVASAGIGAWCARARGNHEFSMQLASPRGNGPATHKA